MPRIRTIKPEFWTDYRLARDHTRDERLFYIGLWNDADDEGRFLAHPRRLLGAIFPYEDDLTEASVSDSLNALAATGRIVLYAVDDEPYGQLEKFAEHQRINRPSTSRIPAPPKDCGVNSVSPHGEISEPSRPRARAREQGAGSREQGNGAGRDDSLRSSSLRETREAFVNGAWEAYLHELGGDGRQPQLTEQRRAKIEALYKEQLVREEAPLEVFRAILKRVKESSWHMGTRAYQMPESLFVNPERRERWALSAINGTPYSAADEDDLEVRARDLIASDRSRELDDMEWLEARSTGAGG